MKSWISILALMLLCLQSTGQLPYWSRVYNYCPDTAAHSSVNVAQCPEDSFFVAAGLHWRPGSNFWQTYITTIDYKGNILHKKTLDFAGKYNRPHGFEFIGTTNPLVKTSSGNYVLTGYEYDVHSNSRIYVYQPWLHFFDKNCDSLLFVKYSDTIVSRKPYSVLEDRQEDYVVTGLISSETIYLDTWDSSYYWDSGYLWMAKYDRDGNEKWSRRHFPTQNSGTGLSGSARGYKIINGHDLSYIIIGVAANTTKNIFDILIMKTDTAGNMLWHNFLPKAYLSWNDMDIVALKNGGYCFISTYNDTLPVGWGGGTPGGDPLIYYGKLNEQGDTIWTRTYRAPNTSGNGKQILETENGDLLLLSKVGYAGKYHSAVTRTDSNGRIKWYREYAHADTSSQAFENNLTTLTYTNTKKLLLSGWFTSRIAVPGFFDSTGQFSWFVLTDTFGCIEPGCQAADTVWEHYYDDVEVVQDNAIDVKIYPNPVKTSLYLSAKGRGHHMDGMTVELIDVLGRKCLTGQLLHSSIDVSSLVPGVYIVRMNGVVVGRVLKE